MYIYVYIYIYIVYIIYIHILQGFFVSTFLQPVNGSENYYGTQSLQLDHSSQLFFKTPYTPKLPIQTIDLQAMLLE